MGVKRKTPPPPSQPHYSDDESFDDVEHYVVEPVAKYAQTRITTELDSEETQTDTDSDLDLPTNSVVARPWTPSGFEDYFEEEGEKQMEKLNLAVKAPEIEPDLKRLKLSELSPSPFQKFASAITRLWSQEDEMALLHALSNYFSVNGKLPPTNDYASFLASFSDFLGFPATEKQLSNKIRVLRNSFVKNIKKGPNVKITNPHKKAVFEMCTRLFQNGTKAALKEVQLESNSGDSENASLAGDGEANGAMPNWSPANSGSGDDAAEMKSCIHLRSMIEDMIRKQQCEMWLSVDGVIARIGESRAQSLEAKSKTLILDAIKLRARKKKLKAEVFEFLAEEMTDE